VTAATPGDVIRVCAGIYHEQVVIAKDVVIEAESGNAIEVESTGSGQASVTITDNTVDTYQKNGITANEPGMRVSINENTVTGVGPTVGAAQNSIQIGFGAQGQITGNSIANNIYQPLHVHDRLPCECRRNPNFPVRRNPHGAHHSRCESSRHLCCRE
jgi:nitrous oxidase accessory protein NosD